MHWSTFSESRQGASRHRAERSQQSGVEASYHPKVFFADNLTWKGAFLSTSFGLSLFVVGPVIGALCAIALGYMRV